MSKGKIGVSYWILLLAIVAVVILYLSFATTWNDEIKDRLVEFSIFVITGFGFLIAIYQLNITRSQYFDDMKKKREEYLDLRVHVEREKQYYSIHTRVLNKSGVKQKVLFAFVLISKQGKDEGEILNYMCENQNLHLQFEITNQFIKLKEHFESPIFLNNCAFIPLPFYYVENVDISNENPGFTYTFNAKKHSLKKGIYSVRFYIYPDWNENLHRCTVDSLIVN